MIKNSIVIGTLNHLDDLLMPCISSIIEYTDLNTTEVIIVSNGCTDGTDDWIKMINQNYPNIRLISFKEPLGYGGANNIGIRHAKGEYIILLNNDIVLLPQPKNQWIDMLSEPFKFDYQTGITGPLKGFSEPGNSDFMIFFCVMIKKQLFDEIGLLNEEYNPGGGEDTEFCIEALKRGYHQWQVPNRPAQFGDGFMVGEFPIYHKGEATMFDNPKWTEIFNRNSLTLAKKYNPEYYKWRISNNCERAVFMPGDIVYPREKTRYEWANRQIFNQFGVKSDIIELGCSNGYGTQFLKYRNYIGYDYDKKILEVADESYGNNDTYFNHIDLEDCALDFWADTIIAFEVLEHISNGTELAQGLKKHCKMLLITAPYKEIPGLWGEHHKLHHLEEKDFPGFEISYISEDGRIIDKPEREDGMNLLLMKWTNES